MSHRSYSPNATDCIFQNIDGEIILLYRKNGNYFSLDNMGVLVWEMICNCFPLDVLEEILVALPPSTAAELRPSIATLIEEMETEGLILPCEPSTMEFASFVESALTAINDGRIGTMAVKLNSYKNIQEKYAHPCGVKEM